MNKNQSTNPDALPDFSVIQDRVTASVRSYQRRIRVLTGAAFLLGFLAVTASVVIVSAYFILYRPKEKEVLRQVTLAAQPPMTNPAPAEGGPAGTPRLPFDFPSIQATMTFFHSVLIALLAGAVGLLGLGTLVLLVVVMLHRRATLNQISVSLAQISDQLKGLQLQKNG